MIHWHFQFKAHPTEVCPPKPEIMAQSQVWTLLQHFVQTRKSYKHLWKGRVLCSVVTNLSSEWLESDKPHHCYSVCTVVWIHAFDLLYNINKANYTKVNKVKIRRIIVVLSLKLLMWHHRYRITSVLTLFFCVSRIACKLEICVQDSTWILRICVLMCIRTMHTRVSVPSKAPKSHNLQMFVAW